jgi:hypothetical protein
MTDVSAHGIAVGLPAGFEAHIYRRVPTGVERCFPVAHFATFAIPAGTGDFGGGATTLMGPDDLFVVLFEYSPESLGTRLFSHRGLPRVLRAEDFRPYVLRRGLPGQGGVQLFFTEGSRPFTLYAVLGSYARRSQLVGRVNDLLGQITIVPSTSPATAPPPPTPASLADKAPTSPVVRLWN